MPGCNSSSPAINFSRYRDTRSRRLRSCSKSATAPIASLSSSSFPPSEYTRTTASAASAASAASGPSEKMTCDSAGMATKWSRAVACYVFLVLSFKGIVLRMLGGCDVVFECLRVKTASPTHSACVCVCAFCVASFDFVGLLVRRHLRANP